LLASSALVAVAFAGAAHAADASWVGGAPSGPVNSDYGTAGNWTPTGPPGSADTAFFGASANTNVGVAAGYTVGGWTFNAGAPAYNFSVAASSGQIIFNGAGIVNGGSVNITTAGNVFFTQTSTAANAQFNITSTGLLYFSSYGSAGSADIVNNGAVGFTNFATAGSASIANNGTVYFLQSATGGNASFVNTAAGIVDFSGAFFPVSAGSIDGGGTFSLGNLQLTVGGNNQSTNVTGVIADGGSHSGTGASLVKVGTGTMILSDVNTYTGATSVNAGTLSVNGSIVSSSGVTVNAGGTLAGTGIVPNTSIVGGTFAPGSGTPGTSTTVTGTLGFDAASTYAVNVSPSTASSANVSSTATLGNATVNAIFAAGSYISKQYTILTAGSIGSTFGTLTNTNLPANFTDTLSYDATHAYLNLTLSFQTPASGGLNGNQNNVANALTNFFNTTGGIPTAFTSLNANGLSQASGQPGASTAQAGFGATGQFVNAIFDGAFDDNSGQGGATGFAEENSYATTPKTSRDAATAYAAVTPRDRMPAFEGRWNIWASAYGGNSRVSGDATAGTSTTTSRVFGTVVGTSYRVSPDTQLGFAMGGSGSSFGLDGGLGGGKADIFNAAVYAKHNWGAAYVAGALTYSWQDTTTDRTVTVAGADTLHAAFKAQAFAARLEGGWRYATPAVGITPYAALQSTTFYLPGYGETATSGSNQFALSYAAHSVTATRDELGTRFDKAILVRDGVFTLKAKTAWAHDWNTDRAATATFQTLPGATFTVNGAQPSADAALVSLGAERSWHNGWAIAANVDGEFSRTTTGYSGKGSLRYAW
jgi:autotransporter-associated beta strand protein